MVEDNNNLNECYDSECDMKKCFNPDHYNFICLDPSCQDKHCENHKHYNKQLLTEYQEHADFSQFDHRQEIDYDKDVDIKICSCADCTDEKEESCEDESCECHSHEHKGDNGEDSCECHEEHHHGHHHSHEGHHHSHEEDSCGCHDESCSSHNHDDVDIKICNCDDCADDDDEEEEDVIAEGKPLLANRSVQIIVSSGILFVLGHILEHFNVYNGLAAEIVFMVGAVIAGYEIAIMAYKSLFKRHTISPALLMCIACVSSFLIGHPEEGAAVTFLYYIAEFLEDYAEQRAKRSIKSLVEIAPETAQIKVGDNVETFKVDDVEVGQVAIVKPGDKIPLDGKVIKGSSSVNQASITGESVPVLKNIGDKVFSGTVNEDGYLEIEVSQNSKNSVISKIVTLVKSSQLNRSHTETYVEKIAKYYTPLIIIITACVAFIPPLFGQNLVEWVYRALSIMVISCPCAFLISTPIGMVSSITSATRQGVLIKGSTHVEEMRNIKAVIFDKTGTLTEGKLEMADLNVLDDKYSQDEVLRIAASLESNSSHPIAKAILNRANESGIDLIEVSNFKNVPGKGITAVIDDVEYFAANESLIGENTSNISYADVKRYSENGKTVIFVGNKEGVIGLITVVDKLRDEAAGVMKSLNDHGVTTIMLTGDNKVSANAVAQKVGVQYVFSDLMPEDKLNILDTIRNKFGDTAMVGDGINDAPALARANVGIAMGAVGSDVAIETADIALMQDDLSKLPYLFKLSTKTMDIIRQNIITSIVVKVLFVILAILGLITLMMSVGIGDMGLTLAVILNSFRIARVKNPIF